MSPGGVSGVGVSIVSSNGVGEGGDAYGDGVVGGVPVVDGSDSIEGVPFVEAIPVVEGGPLSRPRVVSSELIEAELERWRDLLERLGSSTERA